jgi:hypothetical protein
MGLDLKNRSRREALQGSEQEEMIREGHANDPMCMCGNVTLDSINVFN